MQTVLKSKEQEVRIETEGTVTIIGEKINPTGRKKLADALKKKDFEFIRKLALRQVQAGAQVLDVNVGAPGVEEKVMLPEVVKTVNSCTDVPLCLDSNDSEALAAALEVTPGTPLINSVNGEKSKLDSILPLVKEFDTAVIALTMDDEGIPKDPEARLAIAGRIIDRAVKMGIRTENVVIDPLVLTVGADQNAARVTLETIRLVRKEFGVNINLGASNVSFGLPERQTINQAFLALSFGAGASCVITDPEKLSSTILACDLLLGRDSYGKRFLTHIRTVQNA